MAPAGGFLTIYVAPKTPIPQAPKLPRLPSSQDSQGRGPSSSNFCRRAPAGRRRRRRRRRGIRRE
eukprot:9299996-Pyramimonas_sp.AAC.1